jgi:CheY-like chemotaxis protein
VNKFFLLADDDNDDAELFGEALAQANPGVGFHRVEDGRTLLAFLNNPQNPKPDIIFLDLNMPDMNGWQCLARLKNDDDHRDTPVVIYTTSSFPRDKALASESGAHGFLTKPADFKMLIEVLHVVANAETADLKKVLKDLKTD